jgi:hypothetical protein
VAPPDEEVGGMPSPDWTDDDQLVCDIGQALAPVSVDDQLLRAARAAFAWRDIDAELELATMFYDSYLDDAVLVRGHARGAPRTLVFRGEDLGVEIELADGAIEGQLLPPGPGTVTLMTPDGVVCRATADEIGCFACTAPRRGPVRLACSIDGASFTTEWITV